MNDVSVAPVGVRGWHTGTARTAQPRVAVVIPLYNGGRFIREAIGSVLAQTVPPAEIVVVDDGSTDDGAEIVARMTATLPITVLRKPNGGQASARNFGIARTTSALIALLDQDDAWYPDHLQRLVWPFRRAAAPPVGWAYGNLDEVDEAGRMVARSCLRFARSPHPKRDLPACLATDMFVLPSATIIARAAFEAVGGFDERLCGYEDDDLFLRIFRAGFDNVFIDHSVTRWRIYGESASFSPRMGVSRMIYFRKLLSEFPDDPKRGRFFARDCLVPRFFPWIVHDYTGALRGGDNATVAAAWSDLAFASRLHKARVRMIIATLRPVLRRARVARMLLPWLSLVRPALRWLLH